VMISWVKVTGTLRSVTQGNNINTTTL
jgi:hypothetical protein